MEHVQVQVPEGSESEQVVERFIREPSARLHASLSEENGTRDEVADDAPVSGEQDDDDNSVEDGERREGASVRSGSEARSLSGDEGIDQISTEGTTTEEVESPHIDVEANPAKGDPSEDKASNGEQGHSTEAQTERQRGHGGDADINRGDAEETVIGYGSSGEIREGSRQLIGGVWL